MVRKYWPWLVVAAVAVGLVAAVMTPAKGSTKNIGNDELSQLQAKGVAVLDVRTPEEYAAGHLEGAINVPIDQIPVASKSWDEKTPLVLYCATGARSANAASFLSAQGFKEIYNLKSGIVAWTGPTVGGTAGESASVGANAVKTSGKPVFIDFAGSS